MSRIITSETAIIREDVNIGGGTEIWNFANLYGCNIGQNCLIGSYVEIQKDVKIGDNVQVQSHSFLCSLVTVEDDVFIGHGVMTINDKLPPSQKVLGDKSNWEETLIKRGAVIGSNSTLSPVTIGEYAFVGAGSVVTKDVGPHMVVVGNPAKIIGNIWDLRYKNGKLFHEKNSTS
jgi:acetyltransferase-like isoleucine patch superfamily enzyme